jgi:carbon-monoxide dehydrogenase large subunit
VPSVRGAHDPVVYYGCDFERTFEALLAHAGYDALREDVRARQARGELVGLGVATFVELSDQGTFEQARVVPEADGTFTAHVGIAGVGQGVETVLAQVAADRLGVDIERVRISHRDTDLIPEGQGAFASRATVWGGRAIAGAIADLGARACAAAAERAGVAPGEVVFAGGVVRGVGGEEVVPLAELGVAGSFRYEAEPGPLETVAGANLAVAALDAETGAVTLERYAIAVDVGRVVNPLTLRGQLRGAAAMGIGGALLEEFSYGEDGQPTATSFMDYMLPTAAEIPDIDVLLLEFAETVPGDPLAGVKGGGEGGIIAAAATVANAVADALGEAGAGLTSLPIGPATVQRLARGAVAP